VKRFIRFSLSGTVLLTVVSTSNATAHAFPAQNPLLPEKVDNAPDTTESLADLRQQIRILGEKIARLEARERFSPPSAHSSTRKNISKPVVCPSPAIAIVPGTPVIPVVKNASVVPEGYFSIPGTNISVKLGGYIKVDGIYDANQYSGDSSNLPNLRLEGLDVDANRTGVFTAHAKQTRIVLATQTTIPQGELLTFFEGDFFGSSIAGSSAGSFGRTDTSSLNSYNFRIRHAFGSYIYDQVNRLDVGQMWSLFFDAQSTGTTVEFNGPETTAQIRRPQIRYSRTHNCWKYSVSLESGATDYLDISPAFAVPPGSATLAAGSPSPTYNTSQYRRAQNSFIGGMTGDGNQQLPDLIAQVRYEKDKRGHLSFSVMGRQLKIRKVSSEGAGDPPFSATRYGYGIGMGGRLYVHDKSSLYAYTSFGHGIGTYIFALDGYSAALDVSRKQMQVQFAYGFLIGAEHYWSEKLRSNVMFSMAHANVSSFIPRGRVPVTGLNNNVTTTGYSISNIMRQIYVNLLWSPLEKFDVGIEYAHFRRDTVNNYYGYANRFQIGAWYKF
jgi:hypothetical protein